MRQSVCEFAAYLSGVIQKGGGGGFSSLVTIKCHSQINTSAYNRNTDNIFYLTDKVRFFCNTL